MIYADAFDALPMKVREVINGDATCCRPAPNPVQVTEIRKGRLELHDHLQSPADDVFRNGADAERAVMRPGRSTGIAFVNPAKAARRCCLRRPDRYMDR